MHFESRTLTVKAEVSLRIKPCGGAHWRLRARARAHGDCGATNIGQTVTSPTGKVVSAALT